MHFVIKQIYPSMWIHGCFFYSSIIAGNFSKDIKLPIIINFQFYNMINYGASGKSLIFLVIILIIRSLFPQKRNKNKYPIRARFILIGTIFCLNTNFYNYNC